MNNLAERLNNLSPAKRQLLKQKLFAQGLTLTNIPIAPARQQGPFPLSFAQQRLFVLDQLIANRAAYNFPLVVRLDGQLDPEALQTAVNTLLTRHAALRTSFFYGDDDELYQQMSDDTHLPITQIDLSHLEEAHRAKEAEILIRTEVLRPFSLTKDRLIRVSLLQLTEQQHVLVLVMHHITMDGWSLGIIFREIGALYAAIVEKRPSPLAPLPIQYSDYAVWQREWLQGEFVQQQLAYWKGHLQNVPTTLTLPTDRPRPALQTFRGASISSTIPATVLPALQQLAQSTQVTPFMILLAAFQLLLARYTSQEDIVVGSPIANRNRAEIEGVVGFFVNMLVLRTDLSGSPTFCDLLERVRNTTLEAFAHQDVPFEKLVEELRIPRDMSHSPLFQVAFILQNAPSQRVSLPNLTLSLLEAPTTTAKYDLLLILEESLAGLNAVWEYSTDLYDAGTIARLAEQFNYLLCQLVTQPNRPIGEFEIVTPAEKAQIDAWNAAQRPYPTQCLHEIVSQQANKTPQNIAVCAGQTELTYQELEEKSNQLAHYLQTLGVQPGTFVAMAFERSPDMLISLLGILKAGGAYLPIDPTYPTQRIQFMLADAQVPILLTQANLADTLPSHHAQVICLDSGWEVVAQHPTYLPETAVTLDHPLYIIYTSGSTGQPKGVVLPHRALANLLNWQRQATHIKHPARTLQFTSPCFDVHFQEIFTAWQEGSTLVLIPDDVRRDAEQLLAYIEQHQIERLFLPFVALHTLAEAADWQKTYPQSLKEVITAGEALQATPAIRQFFTALPDCVLHNQYGPSESHVVTQYTLAKDPAQWADLPPIGKPVANTQIHLLDKNLQPVPINVPGELYIGGDNLAIGYHNQPQLTEERFIPSPFATNTAVRLYKTGDLARYLPDGSIQYLGRNDFQVKVRGFRIEPGEIETRLQEHPAIAQAVVHPYEQKLVAYVIPEAQQNGASKVSTADLRTFIQDKLPAYMVPHSFMFLDTFPQTPTGKVDRKALPAPSAERDTTTTFAAPRSPIESQIAEMWQTLLNVEKVGIYDNFFALGGDSLTVIRLVSQAKRAGLKFSAQQIFQYQTIAELAPYAETISTHVEHETVEFGEWPLTADQQWLLGRNLIEPHRFTTSLLFKVSVPLDPQLLHDAVKDLVEYHDILRSRFVQDEAGWHQFVDAEVREVPFYQLELDLTEVPPEDQWLPIENLLTPLRESINLEKGPVFQLFYVQLHGIETNRLFLNFHHLIIDGMSTNIVLQDLLFIYMQRMQGNKPTLPPKTINARQWVERLQAYADSPTGHAELDYWLKLPWRSVPPVPVDFADAHKQNTVESSAKETEERIFVSLTEEETKFLLREMQKEHQLSVETVMLTAMTYAISQWNGSTLFSTKMIDNGRNMLTGMEDVDLSRTVGWLSFTRHLLLHWQPEKDFLANAHNIDQQLKAMPNRGLGHEILLRYSQNPETTAAIQQTIPETEDIWINYMGQTSGTSNPVLEPSNEGIGWHMNPKNKRPYLLFCYAHIDNNQFTMQWEYSIKAHHRETIEHVAQTFIDALKNIVHHCQ